MSRSPNKANNSHLFDTAVRLFYDRLTVFQYNQDRLKALGRPIARINAIHSSPTAAAAQADDAGGLESVLYLSEGAPVMLTRNLYSEAGLCNGTPGTVVSILYTDDHRPPSLPVAVLVRFPDYVGPTFNDQPHCVPIPPATAEWFPGDGLQSRQQLPLRLAFALTIHKSQGQTLSRAVIDLGKSERAAGCTFVAISRMRSLQDCLIQLMTFDRLLSISRSRRFQERLSEEDRLHTLVRLATANVPNSN